MSDGRQQSKICCTVPVCASLPAGTLKVPRALGALEGMACVSYGVPVDLTRDGREPTRVAKSASPDGTAGAPAGTAECRRGGIAIFWLASGREVVEFFLDEHKRSSSDSSQTTPFEQMFLYMGLYLA